MRLSAGFGLSSALLCAALVPAPAASQEDAATFWRGSHVFRRLLRDCKFRPLEAWPQLAGDPKKTLLVLLGQPRDAGGELTLDRIPGGLTEFLNQGGAVLFATDQPLAHEELTEVSGYHVSGARVSPWPPEQPQLRRVDFRFLYRNLPQCLVVEPAAPFDPPLFLNSPVPVGQRQLRVVTNRPSYLEVNRELRGKAQVLARIPQGCLYHDIGGFLRRGWTPPAFAVAAQPGAGRLLLLADHKVFANDTISLGLHAGDNENFLFTFNTVAWLRGEPVAWKEKTPVAWQRDRVLFVEDGRIETDLYPPLREDETPLRDLLRGMVNKGNKVLLQIQDRHQQTNHFNRVATQGVNQGPGRALFGRASETNFYKLLIALLALVLLVHGVGRVLRAGHKPDTTAPLFAGIAGQHRPSPSTLVLRQREALAEDDLREHAREAARDWFTALPGCPEFDPPAPQIEATGGWWRSRSLRREVLALWDFMEGGDRPVISQPAFRRFLTRLDQLQGLVDGGSLSIRW